MAILHPGEEEIGRFATPLEPGERRVLERLQAALDDRWHVFVQPHVLDLHPDFVLVAQYRGVTVIEVKNWTPSLYRSSGQVLEVQSNGRWERIPGRDGDPLKKVHDYRIRLADRFVSPPGEDAFRNVRGTLWLLQHDAGAARTLANGATVLDTQAARFVNVAGQAAMTSDEDLQRVVWGGDRRPNGLSRESFERVLARLGEPEAIAEQRRALELSSGGRDIAANPHAAKVRRIRGPAGSGKSVGLAARAAAVAAEGRSVLVLSFNITLAHYLQDLVRREARHMRADHRLVDCIHFHGLCASIVDRSDGDDDGPADDEDEFDLLVRRAERTLANGGPRTRYDAILVDEGQDFRRDWWLLLRNHLLKDGGEMAVVADVAQDIYERSGWLENDVVACGFGPWSTLSGCYRLPADLVPIVNEFGQTFLSAPPEMFPTAPRLHGGLAHAPTSRRWLNLEGDADWQQVAEAISREVRRVLAEPAGPHEADVAVLTNEHRLGAAVASLVAAEGVAVESLFADDMTERRRRKTRFWPGANAVKGSTVHSFKGWEARAVILAITTAPGEAELAYVGLSRVKGWPERSAYVTVLNANRAFDGFKERFERKLSVEDVPGLEGQTALEIP